FPAIPSNPTQEDARRALVKLLVPFQDFPFSSEAGRLVPVAAILTRLAAPVLEGRNEPLFVFDASSPSSGKTLLTEIVSTIVEGDIIRRGAFPGSEEEAEKRLGALAFQGLGMFSFDNVDARHPLGGAALDMLLTCKGHPMFRILGKSEMPTPEWRTTLFATG